MFYDWLFGHLRHDFVLVRMRNFERMFSNFAKELLVSIFVLTM